MSFSPKAYDSLIISYLTGQISADDLRTYRELYRTEAEFRAHVARLELWLTPLSEETQNVSPSETLLSDIMSEIDKNIASANVNSNASSFAVGDGKIARQTGVGTIAAESANDNGAGRWKFATLAASLIAVLAIGSHFTPNSVPPVDDVAAVQEASQSLIALLSDDSQPSLVAIVYNAETREVVARLSNVTLPTDADLELWLIREGANGPVSLGVLDREQDGDSIAFVLPEALHASSDTLAVSLETLGGSGTALGPQGPILFTGGVTKI